MSSDTGPLLPFDPEEGLLRITHADTVGLWKQCHALLDILTDYAANFARYKRHATPEQRSVWDGLRNMLRKMRKEATRLDARIETAYVTSNMADLFLLGSLIYEHIHFLNEWVERAQVLRDE